MSLPTTSGEEPVFPVRTSVAKYDPKAMAGIDHNVVDFIPRRVLPGPRTGNTWPLVEYRSCQSAEPQAVLRPCFCNIVVVVGTEDIAIWTSCESALCREGREALRALSKLGAGPQGLDGLLAIHDVDGKADALRIWHPSLDGIATAVSYRRHRHHGCGGQSSSFAQGQVGPITDTLALRLSKTCTRPRESVCIGCAKANSIGPWPARPTAVMKVPVESKSLI